MDLNSHWFLLAQASQPTGQGLSFWTGLGLAVAILVLPFVVGALFGRLLGVREFSTKIGIVLLSIVLSLTPFAWHLAQGNSLRNAFNLGIDLAGGTNLVFQVLEPEGGEKKITDEVMDEMVAAVGRRINPSGTEELTVRKVGRDRIEVIVPGVDPERVAKIKRDITRLGTLEFALLANRRDHAAIITSAQSVERDLRNEKGEIIAGWRPVFVDPQGVPEEVGRGGDVAVREVEREVLVNGKLTKMIVPEFLVIFPPPEQRITGEDLARSYETIDSTASPAVGFQFNSHGSYLFTNLTTKYQPSRDEFKRRLAILLDDAVHSAPEIEEPIPGSGIIRGRFTRQEVRDLIGVLNAGALVLPINPTPVAEQSISPTLGLDVQEKGKNAIIVSSIAVVALVAAYYLLPGIIANLCLLLNIIMLLGAMAFIDATLTLPGIAGIVLTIGMAVDANVLIYERMREEMARGSSLRMTIQNGFDRAFSSIFDSNLTTLITSAILYMIGTDQVRGFAVTLFLGIVINLYTALYFGRLMFDIIERRRWVRTFKMFGIIGETHVDFLAKQRLWIGASALVILGGIVALFYRGDENLDIDLSGGTMVTFSFVEPQNIDEIRTILQEVPELGTATSLERLTLAGEEQSGDRGRRFRVRTKEQDIAKVRAALANALESSGRALRRVKLELGEIQPISAGGETPPEFVGGHQTELTFTADAEAGTPGSEEPSAIGAATVEDYVIMALRSGSEPGAPPKYPEAEEQVEAEVSETTTGEGGKVVTKVALQAGPAIPQEDLEKALTQVQKTLADNPLFDEINVFDSAVASDMQWTAAMALLASAIAIIAYIWFRFQRVTFGVAAVVALVHDLVITMGLVAIASMLRGTLIGDALMLTDFKVNLPMIAALLTIMGYSLNDTIVVFDRIREVRGKNPAITVDMVNLSLNQTLSRTLLTSFCTFVVVVILYIMGGEGLHGFAFTLILGIAIGTFSSIYIASPVLLWLMRRAGTPAAHARAA